MARIVLYVVFRLKECKEESRNLNEMGCRDLFGDGIFFRSFRRNAIGCYQMLSNAVVEMLSNAIECYPCVCNLVLVENGKR